MNRYKWLEYSIKVLILIGIYFMLGWVGIPWDKYSFLSVGVFTARQVFFLICSVIILARIFGDWLGGISTSRFRIDFLEKINAHPIPNGIPKKQLPSFRSRFRIKWLSYFNRVKKGPVNIIDYPSVETLYQNQIGDFGFNTLICAIETDSSPLLILDSKDASTKFLMPVSEYHKRSIFVAVCLFTAAAVIYFLSPWLDHWLGGI